MKGDAIDWRKSWERRRFLFPLVLGLFWLSSSGVTARSDPQYRTPLILSYLTHRLLARSFALRHRVR